MEIKTIKNQPEIPNNLVIAEYTYSVKTDTEVLKNRKAIKEYKGDISIHIEAIKEFNKTQKENWANTNPQSETYLIRKIETV